MIDNKEFEFDENKSERFQKGITPPPEEDFEFSEEFGELKKQNTHSDDDLINYIEKGYCLSIIEKLKKIIKILKS